MGSRARSAHGWRRRSAAHWPALESTSSAAAWAAAWRAPPADTRRRTAPASAWDCCRGPRAPRPIRGSISRFRPGSTPPKARWSPWRSTPPSSSAGAEARSAKSACSSATASPWWPSIGPAAPHSWSAAINSDVSGCCSRTTRRKRCGWCWKKSATSTPRRRWTSRSNRAVLCRRRLLARRRHGAEVLGDPLLRGASEQDPAGLAQSGRRADLLLAHHLGDLRPPAQEVFQLHHHLPARRLVQLAADVLAGFDDHLRLPRIPADGLEQPQRFRAVPAPQARRQL